MLVRLQGDPALFKCFFPQNTCSLSMINDLCKIPDSTTSSMNKNALKRYVVLMDIKQEQETIFYLMPQIISLLVPQHG